MIYTKTGDNGTTSLVGGTRVRKDDPRVEAYGTVDELNSHIGVVAELLRDTDPEHFAWLKTIQEHLFVIQTLLATEDANLLAQLPQLHNEAVTLLEQHIDTLTQSLPPLRSFVIPGGSLAAAQCHVARCVCRRAERRITTMNCTNSIVNQYINRLSDFLFVLARFNANQQGCEETITVG